MYLVMKNLSMFGTLAVVALLAGPLARLPIDLGAWFLEMLARWIRDARIRSQSASRLAGPRSGDGAPSDRIGCRSPLRQRTPGRPVVSPSAPAPASDPHPIASR